MTVALNRRQFGTGLLAATAGGTLAPGRLLGQANYNGPNVIILRFGGGVRRRETIDLEHTYAPFLRHELAKRGTLFTDMRISAQKDVVTSHAQGTLYILTGRYDKYSDIENKFLSERFEPKAPTLFEYLRKAYNVPSHQTLIVNGEDRESEDFLTFSTNHFYGVNYRSSVLSLHWFKTYVMRAQLHGGDLSDEARLAVETKLAELEARNYRGDAVAQQVKELEAFWADWRAHYGDSGRVNARGDRLLTQLTVRALKSLRPRLMMVNYQDPDYVHWGNMSHYTRAISIIDEGLRQLVDTVEADPFYRGNTIFVIVPDCGRDNNPLMQVSCQHHFNSRSAHEIWALMMGPGIQRGAIVDKPVNQISLAATIGQFMGFKAEVAEGGVLEDAFI